MLTHGNLESDVAMTMRRLPQQGHERFFIFLPLAHVLTRIVALLSLTAGVELIFWQRDPKKLLDELAEAKPTTVPSVPRLFEKIYTAANARSAEAGGAKAAIFNRAVATGRRVLELQRAGKPVGPLLKVQHALADRLVFSKIPRPVRWRDRGVHHRRRPRRSGDPGLLLRGRHPGARGLRMTETSRSPPSTRRTPTGSAPSASRSTAARSGSRTMARC